MDSLNFNKIKKKHLTVILNDEKKTTIFVTSPTKKIMDSLVNIEKNIRSEESEVDDGIIDELYQLCAEIINRNKGNKKISKELIEKLFDIDDVKIFLTEYIKFTSQSIKKKN